ncbi:MAG TPA: HD domain-containing phosphohydrolase [Gemmatimonadales bacterium]|nr:HD domain-containing phosphohydrolase [Gemmatimonadales bacterium]
MTPQRPMILVALRDHTLRRTAGRVLAERGYRVRTASTGTKVLATLKAAPIACTVVDAVLPDIYGLDLLRSIAIDYPALPAILVQGSGDTRAVLASRQLGAVEYLAGPLVASALIAAVARAVREEVASVVRNASPEPTATPERAILTSRPDGARQVQQLAAAALDALVNAMEAKDPHLAGHSIRVAELAASIATHMGRSDWEVEEVRLAGRLHDIGMIAISDGILTKPGKLSPEEFAEVKRHPILGHQILVAYPTMERVASFVRGHHERWDGEGYPDGLAGAAIPWGARVLAAAEIFDALTTSRSYRSAASVVDALERMHLTSAEAVDPMVMRSLQTVVCRRRTLEFVRDDNCDVEAAMLPNILSQDQDHERIAS